MEVLLGLKRFKRTGGCGGIAAEVMDLFTMEHALRMLPSHIACWVRGHKPKTAKEVGFWVDQYQRDRNLDHSVLRRQHRWTPNHRPSGVGNHQSVPTTPEPSLESDPSRKLTLPNRPSNKVTDQTKHHKLAKYFDEVKGPLYFNCKDWGHIGAACPAHFTLTAKTGATLVQLVPPTLL